jgi:hypothetical protein
MIGHRDTASAAARDLIQRYNDHALAEVDLRIEELRSLQHPEALELWIEIRKVICFELEISTDKPTH